MERSITKKYSNGEVTIVWKPDMCIHSAICFRGLPGVFDPRKRPWVTPEGASTEEIIAQVDKCPSGALSWFRNEEEAAGGKVKVEVETLVEPVKDGPLLVYGNVLVKKPNGQTENHSKVTAFCRCGASANKPFCDGSHKKIDFHAE